MALTLTFELAATEENIVVSDTKIVHVKNLTEKRSLAHGLVFPLILAPIKGLEVVFAAAFLEPQGEIDMPVTLTIDSRVFNREPVKPYEVYIDFWFETEEEIPCGEGTTKSFERRLNEKIDLKFALTVPPEKMYFDRYVYRPRRVYRKRDEKGSVVRVEERGSPGCCGICGSRLVVGVDIFWSSKTRCVETYVCESCHSRNVKRGFVHGFRKIEGSSTIVF